MARLSIGEDGRAGVLSVDAHQQQAWEQAAYEQNRTKSELLQEVGRSLLNRMRSLMGEVELHVEEPADEAFCWPEQDVRRYHPSLAAELGRGRRAKP